MFNLPQGQVTGAQWNFVPTGPYSVADLVAAIKSGNISVRIDTAKYPTGEVKGTFIKAPAPAPSSRQPPRPPSP